MAGRLLAAGHTLVVHDARRAAAAPLLDRGAQWADSREGRLSQGDGLASLCSAPGGVVMRLAQGRTYFASNAGDRNALIIYESAIVVGLLSGAPLFGTILQLFDSYAAAWAVFAALSAVVAVVVAVFGAAIHRESQSSYAG